jgi:hypothetical protein
MVIGRPPRPVYELEDMNGTLIQEQFYVEELTAVRVTKRTTYKIDNILDSVLGTAFLNISSV